MKKVPPRKVPSRDEYYMGQAFIITAKSKDPRTQVGAIIVASDNDPLGTGYNGPPAPIDDNNINWDRPAKYPFIIHAEDNAIKHSKPEKLTDATIYVSAAPCKACMLDIVAAKIKKVVYFRPKADAGSLLSNAEEWKTTQEIAKKGGVLLKKFNGNLKWLKDRILWMESVGVFK